VNIVVSELIHSHFVLLLYQIRKYVVVELLHWRHLLFRRRVLLGLLGLNRRRLLLGRGGFWFWKHL
jgi:hypothetical protein